mmetsp:Transcript_60429/g.124291  ORF Transcript_60429/g.124291 Transcript_60429/m.124291 type:complete len:108 (-) Transcript_60429:167-490(-)
MSFLPLVFTTHGQLNPEALRFIHLVTRHITAREFASRGWEQYTEVTFAEHWARHFARYRAKILMVAHKAAAQRLHLLRPWVPPPLGDNRHDYDLELDLPVTPDERRG